MARNPILQEIYAAREQILAEHDGDLAAYIRSANERARASGHPIAQVKQRFIRHVEVKADEVPAHKHTVPPA